MRARFTPARRAVIGRSALLASCAGLALAAGVSAARADVQAIPVNPATIGSSESPGPNGFNYYQDPGNYTFTWDFTANTPITVTQLGYYDSSQSGYGNDGGFGSHLVTLVDVTTATQLGSVTVTADDPVTGAFVYAAIPQVVLNTTDTYAVSGTMTSQYYLVDLNESVTPTASQINYQFQNGDIFGNNSSPGTYNDFGPNFQFLGGGEGPTCTENVPGRDIIALSGDQCVAQPGAYNPTVSGVSNSQLPANYNGFGFLAVNGGSIDSPGDISITTTDPQGTGGSIAIWSYGAGSLITTEGTTTISTAGVGSIGVYASAGGAYTATGDLTVTTSGDGAHGVNADGSGSTINLGNATITTSGQGAVGLYANDSAETGASGSITVGGTLNVTTNGVSSNGVWAQGPGANITANGTTTVTTYGDNSIGVYASGGGLFTGNGDLTVTTSGDGAHGVNADGSNSTINLGNATITTSGQGAVGLYANDSAETGSGGTISVGGTLNVTTNGVSSNGVWAQGPGANITANGTTTVTTYGDNSIGVYASGGGLFTGNGDLTVTTSGDGAHGVNADGSNSTINLGNATITTSGQGAVGLYANDSAETGSGGTISVGGTLNVTTNATSSNGVWAQGPGANITANGTTTVTTYGDNSIGVYASGGGLFTGNGDLTVTTSGDGAHGVNADGSGSTINLGTANNNVVATIVTSGAGAYGAVATGGGQILSSSAAGALSASTTGAGAYALYATGAGSTINVTLGAVSTAADNTAAVVADTGASLTVSGGTVNTTGKGGWGLWADGTGTQLAATNVQVTTTGDLGPASTYGALGAYASNGATISLTGVTITTSGDYAHGVVADSGGSVNLTGGSVTTGGFYAFGLLATGQNSAITTSNGVVVSATGLDGSGVQVLSGATGSLTGGSITTSGDGAAGLVAAGAGSTVTATGVTITTTGGPNPNNNSPSPAVIAENSAQVTLTNDTIISSGGTSYGVGAFTGGGITIAGGSVTVSGVDSWGLLVNGQGSTIATSGGLVVTNTATPSSFSLQGARAENFGALVLSDTTITTSGAGVAGVGVDTNGTASLNTVGVTTTGANADGAFATGAGALTIGDGTQLATSGADAHGLYVSGAGSTATISGNVGITVTGAGAAGVLVDAGGGVSSTGGALTINAANFGVYVNGGAAATSVSLAGSLALTTTSATGAALTLAGDNTSFTGTGGGTIAAAGTAIALLDGTQTASFTGYVITSGGDLIFSDPSTSTVNFTNTTANAGNGNLADVTNGSTLTLNAINSKLTGAFQTSPATDGSSASTSNFNLQGGSIWNVTGSSTVTNLNVVNSSVTFAPTAGFKQLVTTNYTGTGATLTFNAALGGATPAADLLVINGGTATGTTSIKVNPTSVASGPTNLALVTTANGGSIAPGAFTLSGPLVVDGTGYTLQGTGASENLVSAISTSQAGGSVSSLAQSRETAAITGKVLGSILTGATEQINCSSCSSGFASFGSFALGAHGRWTLTPSLALLAGASYDSYSGRGVTVNNSIIGAAALRYDPADGGRYRPFAEAGIAAQPYADITFRRSYQTLLNGGGAGVGVGAASSESVATYGRVGYIWRLSRVDEAAAYGDLTHSWQWTGGYTETASPGNPFGAQVASSLDTMNVWRVGGQYTHLFGEHIEANISLAFAGAFDANYGANAAISALGNVTGAAPTNFDWGEWGARLSYRFSHNVIGDAFVLGTVGAQPVGNQIHGGVALRAEF